MEDDSRVSEPRQKKTYHPRSVLKLVPLGVTCCWSADASNVYGNASTLHIVIQSNVLHSYSIYQKLTDEGFCGSVNPLAKWTDSGLMRQRNDNILDCRTHLAHVGPDAGHQHILAGDLGRDLTRHVTLETDPLQLLLLLGEFLPVLYAHLGFVGQEMVHLQVGLEEILIAGNDQNSI